MENEPTTLLYLLSNSFDLKEIQYLCFTLKIDFDDFPMNLGKKGIVVELIKLCARENKLTELIELCHRERRNVIWPDPRFINTEALLGKPPKPLQPYEPETVLVMAGTFLMGSQQNEDIPDHELPQHELYLPDYYISSFLITNENYAVFLNQARYPKPRGWLGKNPPRGKEQHPVVNVSWFDAAEYCRWLSEQTGRPYRLPTEAEWEKAARGEDGRIYPWGNEWADHLCNHNQKRTTSFNTFPEGISPYGCHDMIGNVREWTSTIWGDDSQTTSYPYPYRIDDGREDQGQSEGVYRIIRSSSHSDDPRHHRSAARAWYSPESADTQRGFRVVMARFSLGI
jgi:formylglycine-generating enzyme required for sulfatase activity